jgi:alkylation response protein AidB-like acyl-CoA dehydrogenase
VKDVFVPESRTVLSVNPPFYEKGPLYQIPRTLLFASGDAAAALGVARACLDAFVELASTKSPRNQILLRDQPMIQDMVGHAEANLRSARAFLVETVEEIWARASAIGALTLDERATLRLATTHGIRQAVSVVDAVYNASGVTAIYDGHLLQRQFQDIHVISQHLQARFAHYELVGQHWLGLPVDETRL